MAEKKRPVLGLTEPIIIYGQKKKKKALTARIDTGATKSAMHEGLAKELELGPVIGKKLVKSTNGQSVRAVIKATVKIANMKIKQDFTVADRSHLRYKVLIGQNILKLKRFIVDPIKK